MPKSYDTISMLVVVFMNALIIFPLDIFAVCIMRGHCGTMIAGLHYEPEGKQAIKYHKQLLLRIGLWLLILLIGVHTASLTGFFWDPIAGYCFGGLTGAIILIGFIYFFTSKKIKKLMKFGRDEYWEAKKLRSQMKEKESLTSENDMKNSQ